MQFQPIDSGLAQKFGPQMPPMAQVLDRYQQQQFIKSQQEAKRQQELSDENRKQFRETLKYSPELALTQFNDELKTGLAEYQTMAAETYKGSNMPTVEQEKALAAKKFSIEGNVNKVKEYKQTLSDVLEIAEKDKSGELNSELVHELLYDTLQGKTIQDLDPSSLKSILADPRAYNGDVVVSNFADSIPEQMETIIEENYDPNRPFRDKIEVKSKFMVIDPNTGDPKIDDNGKPVLNVTPELLRLAMKNQRMALQVNAERERIGEGATNLQAFKNLIKSQAYVEEKTDRSNALVKTDKGSGKSGAETASSRREWLEKAVGYNGKNPDPTQLGKLQDLGISSIQFKIGGKYVDRADMTDITKSFGERTLGKFQSEPTAISIKIPGKADVRGNPTFQTVEIPIKTKEDKEKAIFTLNNIADKMVKAGFEVGTEGIDAPEEEIDDIAGILE